VTQPDASPPVADRIGVALGAMGAGASFGAAVVVAGLLVFRSWQASGTTPPSNVPLLSGPLLIGLALGVGAAWRLARPVADQWHRGVAAGLALFGVAMLAALAAPVDGLAGLPGLAVYGMALVVSGWAALRRVHRASLVRR
jgi:hypothetical protein